MKSSSKSLKFFLCVLSIIYGAKTSASQLQGESVHPQSRYTGTPLSELLKLEYDRPDDPALKAELARVYWCQNQRGLAFEHWKWLENRSSPSLGTWNWAEILKMARSTKHQSSLSELLACSKLRLEP